MAKTEVDSVQVYKLSSSWGHVTNVGTRYRKVWLPLGTGASPPVRSNLVQGQQEILLLPRMRNFGNHEIGMLMSMIHDVQTPILKSHHL